MSVIGNMLNAVKTGKEWIFEGKGDAWKSAEDSIGMLTQLFTNIPLRNLSRDVRAIRNYIENPYAKRPTSAAVLKNQFKDQFMTADNMLGTLNEWFGFYGTKNTDYYNRIYQAEKTGKNEKVAELMEYLTKARGTREETIQQNMRNLFKKDKDLTSEEKLSKQQAWGLKDGSEYIREEYKAGRMDRKTAEKLYREEHPKMTDKQIKSTFDKIDGIETKEDKKEEKKDTTGRWGRGNIDLNKRKVLDNGDGTFSTEESFSVNIDGKEVLLPTIIDGKRVSEEEAIRSYEKTGKYLGKFNTAKEAEVYAEKLHKRQEWYYSK